MFSFLFDFGMATGPITGYVMQYRLIMLNRSVGAFSIDICLVLLFANIMRINFYLFTQYQLALLFQSLLMIAAQVLLLRACTQFYTPPASQASEEALSTGSVAEGEKFWRWGAFDAYVKHIGWFSFGSLMLSLIMKLLQAKAYGEFVGLVALLAESLLILPQIIQIYKQGRVGGISHILLFLNLFGDVIKMYYFVLKDQAFQFKLCGGIQLVLDSFVLLQIFYYRGKEEESGEEQVLKGDKGTAEQDNKDLQGSMSHSVVLQENLQQAEGEQSESKHKQ